MIKFEINRTECRSEGKGKNVDLLSELTLVTAHLLFKILEDCPSPKIRDELIKTHFEATLAAMDLMEKEGEEE